MSSLSAVSPAPDRYVDFAGAVAILHEMGLTDVTERMVRRYADVGKLPFFAGLGRRRRIAESELRAAIRGLQLEAVRGVRRR